MLLAGCTWEVGSAFKKLELLLIKLATTGVDPGFHKRVVVSWHKSLWRSGGGEVLHQKF